MGKFGKITEIIENSVPEFTSLRVVPRGIPYFPDNMLSGTVRFAKRLGNSISVFNPDNVITLAQDASLSDTSIKTTFLFKWLEYGALFSFNGIEMYELLDWDSLNNYLIFSSGISSARAEGEQMYLWATPLRVHASASEGDIQLTVRSRHPLVNGDVIALPSSDTLSSLVEVEVKLVQEAGDSLDPDYPVLYHLILKKPLPLEVTTDNRCYVRAYPAYVSKEIRVPSLSYGQMGPFLVDYLASSLDSKVKYEETFSIRALNGGGNALIGTENTFQQVLPNYPISLRPIWADTFLFWDVVSGSAGFTLPNKFKLKADEEGKAKVVKKLTPEFNSGNAWTFKVLASASGVLRVELAPFGFQDFVLQSNTLQSIEVSTPPGGTLDKISLVLTMEAPQSFVEISNWNLKGSVVDTLQYNYVFKVLGSFNFQSTSLCVKPYFLSLAGLSTEYDTGTVYNGGAIYL